VSHFSLRNTSVKCHITIKKLTKFTNFSVLPAQVQGSAGQDNRVPQHPPPSRPTLDLARCLLQRRRAAGTWHGPDFMSIQNNDFAIWVSTAFSFSWCVDHPGFLGYQADNHPSVSQPRRPALPNRPGVALGELAPQVQRAHYLVLAIER